MNTNFEISFKCGDILSNYGVSKWKTSSASAVRLLKRTIRLMGSSRRQSNKPNSDWEDVSQPLHSPNDQNRQHSNQHKDWQCWKPNTKLCRKITVEFWWKWRVGENCLCDRRKKSADWLKWRRRKRRKSRDWKWCSEWMRRRIRVCRLRSRSKTAVGGKGSKCPLANRKWLRRRDAREAVCASKVKAETNWILGGMLS